MNKLNFGRQLRFFRQQTFDPQSKKILSQQKLGELLGAELKDYGFSGAAISDWERNKSRIHVSNRLVLISLVRVLKQYEGLKTVSDANLLLESGGYSALNSTERENIFPEEFTAISSSIEEDPLSNLQKQRNKKTDKEEILSWETESTATSNPRNWFFISADEFQQILEESKQGPPPAWPKIVTMIFRKITDQISPAHILRGIAWVWIWGLSYWLISPSLQLFHIAKQDATQAMLMYAAGTILIPPLIGFMSNAKKNRFWQEQHVTQPVMFYLYVHQGAYVGFHSGYFFVFLLTFVQVLIGLPPTGLIEGIKIVFPLLIGYIGAQMVPYNLWRIYKQFHLKDGSIFFVFALLGPVWAWFLLEFYEILISPMIGAIVILIAITIIAYQASKKRML